jgi:hypothetical protein
MLLTGAPEKVGAGFFAYIEAPIMVLTEGICKIEDHSWKDEMAMLESTNGRV